MPIESTLCNTANDHLRRSHRASTLLAACGLLAFALIGCGDDDDDGDTDAGHQEDASAEDSSTQRDAADEEDAQALPDAGPDGVTGTVFNLASMPQEGATVCPLEGEEADCVTTGANGVATVNIPDDQAAAVKITGEGFFDSIAMVAEIDGTRTFVGLAINTATVETVLGGFKMEPDPKLGHALILSGMAESFDGYTYSLEEAADSRAYYFAGVGVVNPKLTETSETGRGGALFVNTEPGEHVFTYEHDSMVCDVQAPPGTEADTYDIILEANAITYVLLRNCAEST